MANHVTRADHNGPKNGPDAGHRGHRTEAKHGGNRRRRADDRTAVTEQLDDLEETDTH